MSLFWVLITGLASFFAIIIMTLFSSCCGNEDSEDDHDTVAPRHRAIAAPRETPTFTTIRYSDTTPGTTPNTRDDAASNDSTRSSQISPRATPSRRSEPTRGLASSVDSRDEPQTPVKTRTDAPDVSPSVYSQPSQPRTPPSAGTVCCVGREDEAVGGANAPGLDQQTSVRGSMGAIRKFMGDEDRKEGAVAEGQTSSDGKGKVGSCEEMH